MSSGQVRLAPLPQGRPAPHQLTVRVHRSVVSAGTERMLVGFGRSSWLERARDQPERVRQVLERLSAQGPAATIEAIRGRLHTPLPLGYASAGHVVALGEQVERFQLGDQVACNGPHAELVQVSQNLCALIPSGVDLDQAAFTPLAAIALHGVRLAQLTLGERVLVVGLGLIGSLAAQVALASGCEVIGVERDEARAEAARARYGIVVLAPEALHTSLGCDAALLCVDARSSEPLVEAIKACRRRARVVLLGVSELRVDRALLFERQVTLEVAASYGPGRYEREYEERGATYPLEHVRWTAQRNFAAALALMARGALRPEQLIEERVPFERAPECYEALLKPSSSEAPLATLFEYDVSVPLERPTSLKLRAPLARSTGQLGLGVIGAGLYAQRTFLPACRELDIARVGLISLGGDRAGWLAEREGFELAGGSVDELFAEERVDMVAILTRHDAHAELAARALAASKHVFVEKPLARTLDELDEVMGAARQSGRALMVGFNRRYAPFTTQLRGAIASLNQPVTVQITVNAGALPSSHWLFDKEQGGRILGEACHFIDLARALIGRPMCDVHVTRDGSERDAGALIALSFEGGSSASIAYLTRGPASLTKERVEVYGGQRAARIEGWRRMKIWGKWPGLKKALRRRADKGHEAMLKTFLLAIERGDWPVPPDEVEEVARAVIEAAEQHRAGL